MVDLVHQVQAVYAFGFEHHFCGNRTGRPHVGIGRVQQQAFIRERLAIFILDGQSPVLFARCVQVVAIGLQGRLNYRPRNLHKRSGNVDHNIDVLE